MIPLLNLLRKNATCLSFVAMLLAACTPMPVVSATPITGLTVETATPAPTITYNPLSTVPTTLHPTQTTTLVHPPTLTATPNLWTIHRCLKVPSIFEPWDYGLIWTYTGDIEGRGDVDMLLNFTKDNEILGFVFDFGQLQEYQVEGCVESRTFTMWLKQEGIVKTIIQGEFPETDPRGFLDSSGTLSFDVIIGLLTEKNNPERLPIYLQLLSGDAGTMKSRFEIANVEDDMVILNASRQFLAAVGKEDRDRVVEMLHFPIETWFRGERKIFQTPEAFLAQYDAIFGDGFKERLELTFPNYLTAFTGNSYGIALTVYGGGGINFNEYGQVTAIYNWEKPTPTPAASPGWEQ